MITAEECRIRATECKVLASSIDIPTQRSLEQSIMALNWEALADQIDDDNAQATEARLVALLAGLFRRPLERDDFSSNRHRALSFCLSMIFSENRFPLFRIML
jgi:hypothetical protein